MSSDDYRAASRRQFLGWTGVAAGSAAVFGALGPAGSEPVLDAVAGDIGPDITEDVFGFSFTVRRPQDQLLLNLAFFNCDVDFTTSPPTLTKKLLEGARYLIVSFGNFDRPAPMHVAEQAFTLSNSKLPTQPNAPVKVGSGTSVDPPPVGSRIAGGSRLVFHIPDALLEPNANALRLTKQDMLTWVNLALSVVPNAVAPFTSVGSAPGGLGAPSEPNSLQTAIELPYNLIVSPPVSWANGLLDARLINVFTNAIDPVAHAGWTELWHTRFANKVIETVGDFQFIVVDETRRDLRNIRAVWCMDANFDTDLAANKSSLGDNSDPDFTQKALVYGDRYDIVRLSSDFTPDQQGGPYQRQPTPTDPHAPSTPFIPSPATVDRLMLTSLGAWLECDAHWDLSHYKTGVGKPSKGYSSSLLSWRQRTVQARDTYVRIVRKGYLFPWGHKASLVTLTEREFAEKNGSVGAYLRQKTFIVVTQPVKDYSQSDSVQFQGRNIPFRSVEILTHVTPDLATPVAYIPAVQGSNNAEVLFQPMLAGAPYKFHLRGSDWAGDPIDMHSPVLWVDDTVSYNDNSSPNINIPLLTTKMLSKWNGAPPTIDLHGQRVSLARPKNLNAPAGDTQLVLSSFDLGADRPDSGVTSNHLIDTSQPAFFPALHSAAIQMPEAATLSGNGVGGSTMAYEDTVYLPNGFVGNHGGVFLKTTGTKHQISFNAGKSGGAVTPNLSIAGYSREIGPASGNLPDLITGNFDPQKVFDSVDAKLLGGVPLKVILSTVQFGDNTDNTKALQLTSREKFNPHRIETTLDWHPSIQSGGPSVLGQQITIFEPTGDVDNSMDLHALIISDLDHPAKSTSNITGEIRDFILHLFGDGETNFIDIPFDKLHFHALTGKKTHVDVEIGSDGIKFLGALSFVQELADALNFAGSGLTVDTSGDAITATLTLAIPSLGVGVFSLENLAFNAGVAIPYNGDPVRFNFAFCSRDNPFQLEIMIFSGGGFVGLGVGADGVELLEFSFDFGLGISIDIGIASGQISLTGGVYFECEKDANGGEDIDLTAFVKASGGISALGLISLSIELYLALEYQSSGGNSSLAGDAEMSISVHIIFFGFSIGFSVHKEFAGSSSSAALSQHAATRRINGASAPTDPLTDPATTMITSMSADDFARYCTSFALIGVGV